MGSKRKAVETPKERKQRKKLKKAAKKKKKEEKQEEKSESTKTSSSKRSYGAISPLLHKQQLFMTVSLLPGNLGSVRDNIEEALKQYLLKYSAGFKGILFAFEKLVIQNDGKGRIVGELPHVHYDVECSALLFRPTAAVELEGQIVESFDSHVSMVVYQYFNASITSQHLRNAGFQYNQAQGEWVSMGNEDNTTTTRLSKGIVLRFTIERVHESGGIISIDGSDPRLKAS